MRWWVAALLAVGCGGTAPPPPPGSVTITLGTANLDGTGFLPLSGDQPLVPGAQGGFHVWLKYRVAGMQPAKVDVKRTVTRVSDGQLILLTEGHQDVGAASAAGYWELPMALPSFMCPTPIGIAVQDQPVHFELHMTTLDGAPLGDASAEATPRCPTDTQETFCVKICNG